MSVGNLLTRYALSVRAQGYSEKTIAHTRRVVGFFDDFIGGIGDVREITADDLRRFLVATRQKPKWQGMPQASDKMLSATSLNTYARAIKSFWAWLKREGIIEENPLLQVRPPKLPERLPKVYSEPELTAIFREAKSPRDRAMLELFIDTGITLEELVGLQLAEVDLEGGKVKVFRRKTNQERHAYISAGTASALGAYLLSARPDNGQTGFFLTEEGRPLTAHRVQKILERIGRRAGLKQRLSPHKIRHTFATLSLRAGASLEHVRRMMGHREIATTEVYLHLVDKDVADVHRTTSPVTNLHLHPRGWCLVGGREYEKGSPEFFEAMRRQHSL